MKKFYVILIIVAVLSVGGLAIMLLMKQRTEPKATAKPKFLTYGSDVTESGDGKDDPDPEA